jgi:hypothetical protein
VETVDMAVLQLTVARLFCPASPASLDYRWRLLIGQIMYYS